MRMLLRSTMAALIGLFLLPTYPAGAEEGTHSPNVTHVLNYPHFIRSLDGQRGGGGTDIEFVTLEVSSETPAATPSA